MLANKLSIIGSIVLASVACLSANAATINLGYVSFDVTNPPLAQVDIVNQTGVNSSVVPDTTFPVATPVTFANLTLTVNFQGAPAETFGPASGYFSLDVDGLSLDGQDIFNTSTSTITSVTLAGTFSPLSVALNDGSTGTISGFSTSITDPTGTLQDGDLDLITATFTPSGGNPGIAPEPATWLLLGAGLCLFLVCRGIRGRRGSAAIVTQAALCLCLAAGASKGATTVRLNAATTPGAGVSGSSYVWVTGSGFPAGTFGSVTVTLATSCGAAGTSATAVQEISVAGSTDRVEFLVPASLATGTYFVSVSGSTTGGAFTSSNCSQIAVTHTSAVLASCNPGSSMGILAYNPTGAASTPINAYVPNGYWSGSLTGIQVVPVEGSGSPATVTTPQTINSCSSNSITGQTVCIDNNTGVYLVTGSKVTNTLNTSASAFAGFSGGFCENCTVAVNEAAGTKGQAVIGIGYAASPGETALQFLDLATNTFGTPVPMSHEVSEDILWDPFRNLVLSPDEEGNFDVFQVTGGGTPAPSTVAEYSQYTGGVLDSAAEDCTTQIALASNESYPVGLYITDLSQKKTTAGSPGTLTAPGQLLTMPEFSNFAAGTDGIAVAPGSTHLGIITGEFGGNQFAALSLPATAGTGTPNLVDYVAAALPPTPDGCGFSAGFDPHTTTAYTSPNNGKAYGVMADWYPGEPDYLAVIDLQALLAAPRKAGILPDGSSCSNCVKTVDPAYDLVAHGVVKYIATGNANGGCSRPGVEALRKATVVTKPVNKMPVH
jgi:hypothetical protein